MGMCASACLRVSACVGVWGCACLVLDLSMVSGHADQHCDSTAARAPPQAAEAFGLFCVSTSLTVQLKPHHQPFKVLRKWPDIVALCSNNNKEDAIEAPLIYLKRAELCHQGIERKHLHPRTIELFFQVGILCHRTPRLPIYGGAQPRTPTPVRSNTRMRSCLSQEMTFNVVYSFYPCALEEAACLAAIHLAIECPTPKPNKEDVADCEGCQLPDHLRRQTTATKWRKAVLDAHDALQAEASGAADVELMLRYIKRGRAWPFYGSTFFYGFALRPPSPSRTRIRF